RSRARQNQGTLGYSAAPAPSDHPPVWLPNCARCTAATHEKAPRGGFPLGTLWATTVGSASTYNGDGRAHGTRCPDRENYPQRGGTRPSRRSSYARTTS